MTLPQQAQQNVCDRNRWLENKQGVRESGKKYGKQYALLLLNKLAAKWQVSLTPAKKLTELDGWKINLHFVCLKEIIFNS